MFPMPIIQTRRRFLTTLSLAGAAGLVRAPRVLAAEGPLETTTVRILKTYGICTAPGYVAEELLRAEGFTDIRYVHLGPSVELAIKVGRGEVDFSLDFAARIVQTIGDGGAILVLGGIHVGCYELFAKEEIRSVGDLKGKTVGVGIGGPNQHAFLAARPPMSGSTRDTISAGSPSPIRLSSRSSSSQKARSMLSSALRRSRSNCGPSGSVT
jgi:NitT/TauT family transport system substrate-binding protein